VIIELSISVLVSCIGAAVVAVAARLRARVEAFRVERRCGTVEGTFVSEFRPRSTEVVTRAITRLVQEGQKVRGTTIELEGARAWEIQGQIDTRGFLHGTYAPADEPHRSLGTFLLSLGRDAEELAGLWSHCDSASKKVSGGEYLMRRCEGFA